MAKKPQHAQNNQRSQQGKQGQQLGGQLSGEHGIGNGRLEFLEEFAGPRMIALYKAIKLAFDDKLILNPGKVIEYNK